MNAYLDMMTSHGSYWVSCRGIAGSDRARRADAEFAIQQGDSRFSAFVLAQLFASQEDLEKSKEQLDALDRARERKATTKEKEQTVVPST
jgi:hypothetical protein